MKKHGSESAFTFIELLAVLAIITILAAVLLPAHPSHKGIKGIQCMSQIRQIQFCLIRYADDNHGEFPFQMSVTNGGGLDFISGQSAISDQQVLPYFQQLSAYLKQPQIFRCPFDTNRMAATSYATLNRLAISYFLNVDASPNTEKPSQLILSGDRFLRANGQPVKTGLFTVTKNLDMSWTPNAHSGWGNLGFVDGHVERNMTIRLNSIIQNQPIATNHFCIP